MTTEEAFIASTSLFGCWEFTFQKMKFQDLGKTVELFFFGVMQDSEDKQHPLTKDQ